MPQKRKLSDRSPKTTRDGRPLKVTRGGRKIVRFMAKRNLKITELASAAGVDRLSILRSTNGERWQFISVDFALAMRDATGGYITVEDFASVTALPVGESGDEDGPLLRKKTGTDG